MRIRMADTDADEKIRMRKCGWRINADEKMWMEDKTRMRKGEWRIKRG